jgi:hypothetical protein
MSKKGERQARAAAAKEEIKKAREYAKNQKQRLKSKGEGGGYFSLLPNAVYRVVIPRIISDVYDKAFAGAKRRPDVTDIAFLYGILLSYANTDEENDYEGAAWVSTENLAELMRISRNRIAPLCRVLEENGLLRTVSFYEGIKRRKLYYAIHITKVSEDGYVVNEDGEKILPSFDVYKALAPNTKGAQSSACTLQSTAANAKN